MEKEVEKKIYNMKRETIMCADVMYYYSVLDVID